MKLVPNETKIQTFLVDEETGQELLITLYLSKQGISIEAEGYGDCSSQNGEGLPIYIELYNGQFTVSVWNDINKEDPRVINLDNAKEELRTNEQE